MMQTVSEKSRKQQKLSNVLRLYTFWNLEIGLPVTPFNPYWQNHMHLFASFLSNDSNIVGLPQSTDVLKADKTSKDQAFGKSKN